MMNEINFLYYKEYFLYLVNRLTNYISIIFNLL